MWILTKFFYILYPTPLRGSTSKLSTAISPKPIARLQIVENLISKRKFFPKSIIIPNKLKPWHPHRILEQIWNGVMCTELSTIYLYVHFTVHSKPLFRYRLRFSSWMFYTGCLSIIQFIHRCLAWKIDGMKGIAETQLSQPNQLWAQSNSMKTAWRVYSVHHMYRGVHNRIIRNFYDFQRRSYLIPTHLVPKHFFPTPPV